MRIGGPLRGWAPGAAREQARRGLGAGARRILGTLRNGKDELGEDGVLGTSADGVVPSAKVWRETMTKYEILLFVLCAS